MAPPAIVTPSAPRTRRLAAFAHAALAVMLGACGGAAGVDGAGVTTPGSSARTLTLELALPHLERAREGRYQAWTVAGTGARTALGRFDAGGTLTIPLASADVSRVEITLEPPGDADDVPSPQVLLRGEVRGGAAELSYVGAVTAADVPLRDAPGQFTMFTPSDNDFAGYPSHEESGVWLFNMLPGATAQRDYYVRVAQLQPGWTYEGWMVRDIDQPSAIWLSYGKFVPDWTGALNQPDDTGWGPFSGVTDYRTARLEDFPGDDWISNPLALPWTNGLALPLNLREKNAAGAGHWTHVITIEPSRDRGEPVTTERPFFMRPYADPFGDLGPGVPRTISAPRLSVMPHGSAVVR